jgi:hypothetical protein
VHGRFYLATLPLGVGLVGPGLIGKTFLAQIQNQMKVFAPIFIQGLPLCVSTVNLQGSYRIIWEFLET